MIYQNKPARPVTIGQNQRIIKLEWNKGVKTMI